jgi:hypothetical protein
MPVAQTGSLARATPVPNRIAGSMVVAGGAIAIVGCFLPWISASALFLTVTRDGISSPDGQVIAGLAVFSCLFGVLMLARRVGVVVPIVLVLTAGLALWAVVLDYQDLSSRVASLSSDSSSTIPIVAQIGAGIYATGLGIAVWAFGAIYGFRR